MGGIVSTLAGAASKATPWGAIAAGAGALTNLGLGIADRIRQNKLNKKWDVLNAQRPDYEIPQEYQNILAQYQQAYAGNMPGYDQTLSQIGQLGARSRGAAERGAISSNAYGSQVGDLYQKELDAIQGLGVKQEEYKSQQLDKVAGAQGMMGGQKEKAQEWNVLGDWTTKMNQLESQMGATSSNSGNAFSNASSILSNFLGTKAFQDIYKKMNPQGTQGTGFLGGNG